MESKKNYWYVLVLTNQGPKFVTSTFGHKECKWEIDKQPKEFPRDFARDMCIGLMWNGWVAFPVCVAYEITEQPFLYKYGEFEWKYNEEDK